MTNHINQRWEKPLFPRPARDQRNHQLFIILLVLLAGLSGAGSLIRWMTPGRH